jgi:hypothetical protein
VLRRAMRALVLARCDRPGLDLECACGSRSHNGRAGGSLFRAARSPKFGVGSCLSRSAGACPNRRRPHRGYA